MSIGNSMRVSVSFSGSSIMTLISIFVLVLSFSNL
jgi:hypothetical protein